MTMPCRCDRHDRRHGQCDPSCPCWHEMLPKPALSPPRAHEHHWALGPVTVWTTNTAGNIGEEFEIGRTAERVMVICQGAGCDAVREVLRGNDGWFIQ